jgi:uncharacterized membrane protein YfcA
VIVFLAALICIILGFVSAIVDEPILFGSLVWFVASIAISVLAAPEAWPWRRSSQ